MLGQGVWNQGVEEERRRRRREEEEEERRRGFICDSECSLSRGGEVGRQAV